MPVGTLPTSTLHVSAQAVSTPEPVSSFEERWAAWQARGVAHDRAVRRKMIIAAPIAMALAAVLYLLFAR
jgi:hypothetical protein